MDTLTQMDFRAIVGLALAFAIVVGAVGYFVRQAAGERPRTDSGGGRRTSPGDSHDETGGGRR